MNEFIEAITIGFVYTLGLSLLCIMLFYLIKYLKENDDDKFGGAGC